MIYNQVWQMSHYYCIWKKKSRSHGSWSLAPEKISLFIHLLLTNSQKRKSVSPIHFKKKRWAHFFIPSEKQWDHRTEWGLRLKGFECKKELKKKYSWEWHYNQVYILDFYTQKKVYWFLHSFFLSFTHNWFVI